MNTPNTPLLYNFSFVVAVEDEAALRESCPNSSSPDLEQLVLNAIKLPACSKNENGLGAVNISTVKTVSKTLPGMFHISIEASVDHPDKLWESAQRTYASRNQVDLDGVLSTTEQIHELILGANTSPSFRQMGLKAWPHESIDDQHDVTFVWTYPDGFESSLPAHVDEATGVISIFGKYKEDVWDNDVVQMIKTEFGYYPADVNPVNGEYLWVLVGDNLDSFRGERADVLEYIEASNGQALSGHTDQQRSQSPS